MISQEEIDIIKGHLTEEEAIQIHNENLDVPSKELLQCFICKGWHRRGDGDFVYHSSIPADRKVVCTNHAGVRDWYERLLEESRERLKEMENENEHSQSGS